MSNMIYRTTFTLDEITVKRLKHLAELWQVSQAEVVRRSIALAETEQNNVRPDPVVLLRELHAQAQGLDQKAANAYLAEIRTDRKRWRDQ